MANFEFKPIGSDEWKPLVSVAESDMSYGFMEFASEVEYKKAIDLMHVLKSKSSLTVEEQSEITQLELSIQHYEHKNFPL